MRLKTEEKGSYYSTYKKQLNIAVSEELYENFKTKCSSYGFGMTAVLTDYMLNFIDKPDGIPSQLQEKGWKDGSK